MPAPDILMTWNMQGDTTDSESLWPRVASMATGARADIVLLQEVTSPPRSGRDPVQSVLADQNSRTYTTIQVDYGRDPERGMWRMYFLDAGLRQMLVVMIRRIWVAFQHRLVVLADGWNSRPAFGVRMDTNAGIVDSYFSIHAISGGGPNAAALVNAVAGAAPANEFWHVAGDFNREPNTVAMPGTIYNTTQPTRPRSGRRLDWMVTNDPNAFACTLMTTSLSDHNAVSFGH